MGEIRIRFLIIFPVKGALDPVGEGEGLALELTGTFRGQVGAPKEGEPC